MVRLRNELLVSRSGPVRSRHSDYACKQVTGKTKIGRCGFGMAQGRMHASFHVLKFSIPFTSRPDSRH
jgi:hypothetical protein